MNQKTERPPKHAVALLGILAPMGVQTILGAEIGVYRGDLSSALLRRLPHLHLTMIDTWATCDEANPYWRTGDPLSKLSIEEQLTNRDQSLSVTAFAGDRRTVLQMDSLAASLTIPEESLDFVFIDGDHSYEGVTKDLVAWWPKLRSGGVFSGHDYGGGRWVRGVKRAVDEFVTCQSLVLQLANAKVWWVTKPEQKGD